MKEYWVNVYESGYIGCKFDFKPHWNKDSIFGRIIYRIHVKMKDKPLMHQRVGRIRRPLITTHWMDD